MSKSNKYLDSNIELIKKKGYKILPDSALKFLEKWYSDGVATIKKGTDIDGKEMITIKNSNGIMSASLNLYENGHWTAWTSNDMFM